MCIRDRIYSTKQQQKGENRKSGRLLRSIGKQSGESVMFVFQLFSATFVQRKKKGNLFAKYKQNKRLTIKVVQWQATRKSISPSMLATFNT